MDGQNLDALNKPKTHSGNENYQGFLNDNKKCPLFWAILRPQTTRKLLEVTLFLQPSSLYLLATCWHQTLAAPCSQGGKIHMQPTVLKGT